MFSAFAPRILSRCCPEFRNWILSGNSGLLPCPPYGKEIEPYVPDKSEVLQSVKQLSGIVGTKAVGWLPAAAPDVHRLIFSTIKV